MQVAKQAGYSVEGIDVSPASTQLCKQKGLYARSGDFLTERFDGKFDLVTMWDVVEHLRNPGAFLERARELLAEGGVLFAKIPIFGDLSVHLSDKVPRAAGILLGAPDHVQYFDRESLERLIRRVRFEPEWLSPASIRSHTKGGSLKRRAARQVQSVIKAASGDSNAFVMATPA
jgi:SAM-dependent methyltransferase